MERVNTGLSRVGAVKRPSRDPRDPLRAMVGGSRLDDYVPQLVALLDWNHFFFGLILQLTFL